MPSAQNHQNVWKHRFSVKQVTSKVMIQTSFMVSGDFCRDKFKQNYLLKKSQISRFTHKHLNSSPQIQKTMLCLDDTICMKATKQSMHRTLANTV